MGHFYNIEYVVEGPQSEIKELHDILHDTEKKLKAIKKANFDKQVLKLKQSKSCSEMSEDRLNLYVDDYKERKCYALMRKLCCRFWDVSDFVISPGLMSDVKLAEDGTLRFECSGRGAQSIMTILIPEAFHNVKVYYRGFCDGGSEGIWTNDAEGKYFKAGYTLDPFYTEFGFEQGSAEYIKAKEILDKTGPRWSLVCDTLPELLEQIGKRTGRNLSKEEWNAEGIGFTTILFFKD